MNQSDARQPAASTPVDWQTTPRPARPLTVRLRMVQWIAFGMLAAFFGGISLLLLTSGHVKPRELAMSALFCGIVLVVGFLLWRSRRKAAREFDAGGVRRGDGRRLDWDAFREVVVQTRRRVPSAPAFIWRVELVFADGETVWIIPRQVANADEVLAYVNILPRVRQQPV